MRSFGRRWMPMVTALACVLAVLPPGVLLADGEGQATIEPAGVVVGASAGTWTIIYRPGSEGLAPGGGLRLHLSGFPINLFATPQCDDPAGPNYTTARCTREGVPVQVRMVRELRQGWQDVQELAVTVGEPGLRAEDALLVVYGDTSGGGPGGRVRSQEGDDLPVRVYSDTDGDGKSAPLAQFPRLTVAGGMAARLVLAAPSQAVAGQPVRLVVSARDPANALATEATPVVAIAGPGLRESREVRFPEGQRAVAPVEVVFRQPGVYRVEARAKEAPEGVVTIQPGGFVAQTRPVRDAEPGFLPELTRVEVTATEIAPGSAIRVVAYWRNAGTAPASKEYRVSCHLERRPAGGRALANWDYRPSTPTTRWQPGDEIVETQRGSVQASVPPGEHMLTLGLYHSPEPGKFTVLAAYDVCRIRVGPELPVVTDIALGRSNPIRVLANEPPRKLLWGDLHCHTENSGDGSGSVRGLYTYARDVSRLDFCACADHVGPKYPADQWREIQEMARAFYDPGRFVAILGYEWSTMHHGDKNVYFARDDEAIRVPESGEPEDLYEMLTGADCIVIPHHPAYPVGLRGTDWTRIDPALVPVVEMCSAHGLGEHLGNPRPYGGNKPMGPSLPGGFAQDALARGLRLGFIASSDDHSAHAGKIGFLAAVYADSFDRQGILNALRARRCYASTGARILLDFTADGEPMGSLLERKAPPALSLQVHGTAPVAKLEIVRNGEVCCSREPGAEDCSLEYRDQALQDEECYYYARVTQSDGEMAWSSPIFVRNTGLLPRLTLRDVKALPEEPRIGQRASVSTVVRNEGTAASEPCEVWFMLDGAPARPVGRERQPAKSGIGGLMAGPGLQVWRWPVDERSVNVFLRWGGDDQARDWVGEVRVLGAEKHVWTPFHVEDEDSIQEAGDGVIRWRTMAEAGTGDGLNLWVRIDPRKRTRLVIDARRGGEQRAAEVFTHAGPLEKLPFELDLVEYDAGRWIGDIALPPLKPGKERQVRVRWRPEEAREGELRCRVLGGDGEVLASREGPRIRIRRE